MCSVNDLCWFFLIGWQCGSVRQEGVGGLAFLLPKDSFKASFLHHCGGERERDTSSSVLLLLLSAGGERWVTSHHWQLVTELISNDYTCSKALHFKHLGECIGSGGALWLLCMSVQFWTGHGSSSIIRHMHCKKKATQMAETFMHVVQLMWRHWNWSWVCASRLWWSWVFWRDFKCTVFLRIKFHMNFIGF